MSEPTRQSVRRPWALPAGLVIMLAGALLAYNAWRGGAPLGPVSLPEFSQVAVQGRQIFNAECAGCHGNDALGGEQGPPLVHIYYEPGHHGDGAFQRAVSEGVRQHHWNFGDMPAQPHIGARDIQAIIAFVRELQRANGID